MSKAEADDGESAGYLDCAGRAIAATALQSAVKGLVLLVSPRVQKRRRVRLAAAVQMTAAFTLIELLVVVAIIAVLAALLLPVISRSQESGRSTACLSNLRQLGLAVQMHVHDNENKLPKIYDAVLDGSVVTNAEFTMNVVLSNYLGNPRILRCPSDRPQLFEQTGSSYAWNILINDQDADHLTVFAINFDPHNIPIAFDKQAFHASIGNGRGVNYLYADGHIKNLLAIEGTK